MDGSSLKPSSRWSFGRGVGPLHHRLNHGFKGSGAAVAGQKMEMPPRNQVSRNALSIRPAASVNRDRVAACALVGLRAHMAFITF